MARPSSSFTTSSTIPKEYENLAAIPEQQVNRGRLAKMLSAGWRGALPETSIPRQARE